MARNLKGVDSRGDVAICMVVACQRKALYRSPAQRSERGYCSAHKHLAMTGMTTTWDERNHRALLAYVEHMANLPR